MKYAREIKVGVLAAVCLFLLFFGFNFLKGKNIFSPTNSYHGIYAHLHGLEEQAAVYVCGHKVGQVNAIHYDFTRDSAFIVDISINKDIALPQGTTMALIPDGLLGGVLMKLQLPRSTPSKDQAPIEKGSEPDGEFAERIVGEGVSGGRRCGFACGGTEDAGGRRSYQTIAGERTSYLQ